MGKLSSHTTTVVTFSTDDGVDITLPSTPYDGEVYTGVKADGTIRVAYLVHDSDPENPLTAYDCGEYEEFHTSRSWGNDNFERVKGLIRDHGKRVRLVHNLGDRRVGAPYVSRDGIEDAVGAFVIPEDVPEESRDEYAAAVFEEVGAWADGEVYGVISFECTPGGGIIGEEDACFGYYGDYAETVAREYVTSESDR